MTIKTIFLLFLFLLMVLIGVILARIIQVKKIQNRLFVPQNSDFKLTPAAESLKGKLTSIKGQVKIQPRGQEEYQPAGQGITLLPGDKLAVVAKSESVVDFTDFLKLNLQSAGEVLFVNLIPDKFTLQQNFGEVSFELLQDNYPVSIRSLDCLIVLESGQGSIGVDGQGIQLKMGSGEAKIAMVDLENETRVWEINKNQTALIDTQERRVQVK